MTTRTLMTYLEACTALAIGRKGLYALIAAKKLRPVRLSGRMLRIDPADVERLIEEAKGQDAKGKARAG